MNTPQSFRPHIGIFGKSNTGKSTLMNFLTGQKVSLVSENPGTTTDSVMKAMEIHGLGPVVFIDAPGFSDGTALSDEREEIAFEAMKKCSLAIYLLSGDENDEKYMGILKEKGITILPVIMEYDGSREGNTSYENKDTMIVSVSETDDRKKLIIEILRLLKTGNEEKKSLTGKLAGEDSLVLLVMPQDKGAPKGRLIMPQVQAIRDLLDKKAVVISAVPEKLTEALSYLSKKPDLVITDSQCFGEVSAIIPGDIKLTSFSILMSALKGDLGYFTDSLNALNNIGKDSRILIAEACTHPPEKEDIGTVKIPALLRKRFDVSIIKGPQYVVGQKYLTTICCIEYILSP